MTDYSPLELSLPELMLSAGKIDLCGELYHNGEPLNL